MKKVLIFILFFFIIHNTKAELADSIPITISSSIFSSYTSDEWIHLRIIDTLTNQIWYDSLATVTCLNGFHDTIYLDSGTYKCEVLDMGAYVTNPIITLDNGYVVPITCNTPPAPYYLFTLPSYMNIITNEKNELIKIFPNPVNNILIINCEDIRETTMQIINMIGECVLQQKLNSEVNEINVSLLAKGMYIIKLNGKNYTEQKKLTKE